MNRKQRVARASGLLEGEGSFLTKLEDTLQ